MSAPKLPREMRARIAEGRAAGQTKAEVARRLNICPGAVRRYWDWDPAADPETDPVAEAAARITAEAGRRDLAAAVKELAFRDWLGGLIRAEAEPFDPPPVTKAHKTSKGHERFPLLHLSDWHFEEVVRPDAVLGLNTYDIPTACRRVFRVVGAFRHWAQMVRSGGFAIPELSVALNGDLISGTLHGLERHSSAPNVVRAARACGRLIALAIRDLAADFPRVRVYCSYGNHGRLPDDKKVPTKDPTRNWDYVAYSFAEAYLSQCAGVSFVLPDAWGVVYEVGGHTVYQGHGHFIKQQLGIVGYGMRRFVSNLAANMGAAGKPLRYAVFGHFHQANASEFAGVTAFIGPSLIGTQEYGFLAGGSVNRPAQQCYVFDRALGHVSTETLYGNGPGYDGTYPIEV